MQTPLSPSTGHRTISYLGTLEVTPRAPKAATVSKGPNRPETSRLNAEVSVEFGDHGKTQAAEISIPDLCRAFRIDIVEGAGHLRGVFTVKDTPLIVACYLRLGHEELRGEFTILPGENGGLTSTSDQPPGRHGSRSLATGCFVGKRKTSRARPA